MFGKRKEKRLKELEERKDRIDLLAKHVLTEKEYDQLQKDLEEIEERHRRHMKINRMVLIYLAAYMVIGIGTVVASFWFPKLDGFLDWFFVIGNTGILYYMIWTKEFNIKEGWKELPFSLRSAFWIGFCFNLYTVLDRMWDMFIKGS